MDWFDVVQERERIVEGKVEEFQVALKVGFKIELLVLPTTKAIAALKKSPDETNAILHVTC
jgi:hypothetical protein